MDKRFEEALNQDCGYWLGILAHLSQAVTQAAQDSSMNLDVGLDDMVDVIKCIQKHRENVRNLRKHQRMWTIRGRLVPENLLNAVRRMYSFGRSPDSMDRAICEEAKKMGLTYSINERDAILAAIKDNWALECFLKTED